MPLSVQLEAGGAFVNSNDAIAMGNGSGNVTNWRIDPFFCLPSAPTRPTWSITTRPGSCGIRPKSAITPR